VIYVFGDLCSGSPHAQGRSAVLGEIPGFPAFFQDRIMVLESFRQALSWPSWSSPSSFPFSREVILAVPQVYKESAYALGATVGGHLHDHSQLRKIRNSGRCHPGFGRAIGETMAVTMIIGNNVKISASLFSPGYTLPASLP